MFGNNEPARPVYDDGAELNVTKVFLTIQGEGPLAGTPAVFVRLQGCNLRCRFCDTDFDSGTRRRTEDLAQEVIEKAGASVDLIVLTGGEPLAQNIVPLIKLLGERGLLCQIETAGTVYQEGLEDCVVKYGTKIVCSPKTATVNARVQLLCSDWKYIIRAGELDPTDGLPVRSTQPVGGPTRLFRPIDPAARIWVQPCDEYFNAPVGINFTEGNLVRDKQSTFANYQACVDVALAYGYRISFQIHKVLGVE